VGIIFSILKALALVPALKGIAKQIEDALRRSEANSRRDEKLKYIDDAIADAITHPSKRVRDNEVRQRSRSDKEKS
jgi:hypothetical protein